MTSIETRLALLEKTVKLQRLGMVTALLAAVVVWSAGAMSKTPLDSLKAKELLIETEEGKTIARLGGDGKGGAMLSISMDSTSGERSLQLVVNEKSSSLTAVCDGSTTEISAGVNDSRAVLTSKDGNKIELGSNSRSTMTLSHKGETWSRVLIDSDPKAHPVILLRERDESIRWQSPKRGN